MSKFNTCIFDLDDTLYPLSSGIATACRANIYDFMVEKLGFDSATVADLGRQLYLEHGTTMAGLRASGHKFDFDDYHEHVHGRLPYELLKPDPVLRSLLHSMPQRKVIFTNGDKIHAARCLKNLGLEDCFDTIIAFETIMAYPAFSPAPLRQEALVLEVDGPEGLGQSWVSAAGPLICCKPQEEAFRRALAIAKADAEHTVFFDDSVRNIAAAKRAGLYTVLVGSSSRSEGADWAVASIHNAREAVPDLWDGPGSVDALVMEGAVEVEYVGA